MHIIIISCCWFISLYGQEQGSIQFSADFLNAVHTSEQNSIKPEFISAESPKIKQTDGITSFCAKIRKAIVAYAVYATGVNSYQLYKNLNATEWSIAQLVGVNSITAYVQFGVAMAKVALLVWLVNYVYHLIE